MAAIQTNHRHGNQDLPSRAIGTRQRGRVLAIAPGRASICAWSPGLDASGNSHLGTLALEMLAKRMGWSIFGA